MDRRRIPHESGEVSCARLPDAIGEFVRSSDARKGPKEVDKADGSSAPAPSRESRKWRRSLQSTFLWYRSHEENTSNKHFRPVVGAYALQVVWVPEPRHVYWGSSNPFSRTEKHRQAHRVGISQAYCVFGLWHHGIHCAEIRTTSACKRRRRCGRLT